MTGWANGGVRQKVLTSVHTLNELGGDRGMKKRIAFARDKGINLFFDGISCFAYDSGLFEGFLPFSNAARFTTREQAILYNYDMVTYKQCDWQDTYYLVRPDYAQKCADNLINALKDRDAAGVAFRYIGNLLSADYYMQNTVTREQVKAKNSDTLRDAVSKGLKISIKEGNNYAIPYADMITDMNLTGNAYAIIDRRIPFYQIALHGTKDYTGEAINLAGDYQTALLECAEYGAGLNFTFMAEDTWVLQDSFYTSYYGASYDAWKEDALSLIAAYQTDLKGLNSQRIVDHMILDADNRVTVYENGTKVYVNYGTEDYAAGAVLVPARGYVVEGGERE